MRARSWCGVAVAACLLAACGGTRATAIATPDRPSPTIAVETTTDAVPITPAPTTTAAAATPATTTPAPSVLPTEAATSTTAPVASSSSGAGPATTTAPAVVVSTPPAADPDQPMQPVGTRTIGTSVQGRPIVATRYGTPGGIPVLAVGVIHGDEKGGLRVLDQLRSRPLSTGIDLWTIDTVNPDGMEAGTRGNANGVDLNRNFATDDWQPVGRGTTRWAGTGPGSEPETQSVQAFVSEIRPRFSVWWHQVGNHVDQNEDVADYTLLEEFARRTGMPIIVTSCGSTPCVGNATTFVNALPSATSFVVELPSRVTDTIAARQAAAFLDVATSLTGRTS